MKETVIKALRLIKYIFFSALFYPLKIKNNKIVFCSFYGTQFNAQPKMIFDELQSRNIQGLDIVWILPDDYPHTEQFRTVKPKSIKSIYELSTAKVWVDNSRKGFWIKKKRTQFYIQTWHGKVYIKSVEADCENSLTKLYVWGAKRDSKNADYVVAETEWGLEIIKRAFWYKGNIIKGEFKNKALTNKKEAIEKVKVAFNIKEDEKIILYVPTFRKDKNLDCYDIDYQRVITALKSEYGYNYRFIVRLHPNIASLGGFIDYSDSVLNGTPYNSIDELIVASDMIISDYSGCIFEGYRAGKPVFLYTKDLNKYISDDRWLYFDIFNLPSPVAMTNDDLLSFLIKFDSIQYNKQRKEFVEKMGYYSEDAAKNSTDIIIKEFQTNNN